MKKTNERWENLFFVSLAGLFFVSGAFLWLGFSDRLTELQAENTALSHHLTVLCNYIDSLPKKYRAVYEVCLEQEKTERR